MKTNSFRLESGREYTLGQIFSGNNKIIIPDLQRDYCWGDKAWNKDTDNYNELVSKFIDDLISSLKNDDKKLMLGLIYGFESPHFHIQLCDGQQRLTTFFLLIGMINRKVGRNKFENLLVSKDEASGEKESNLQYAIRESTVYFLNDLVNKFFLTNEITIEDIKKQSWYFKEYDLDASIQSMLSAISIIDEKLKSINEEDCKKFGNFVTNNIQLLYYDMGSRTRGEETFVVINTTGEPLTATENLKPILIGNILNEDEREKVSNEWEEREEWFWKNRDKDKNEQTSDNGLREFFIWYWQIRLLQEKSWKDNKSYTLDPKTLFLNKPLINERKEYNEEETPDVEKWEESIKLDTVHKYFNALKLLVEKCENDEKVKEVLKTFDKKKEVSLSWFREADLNIVLPLIVYCEKFPKLEYFYEFVRRIRKNHYDKKWKDRNANYVDWRHIIQIIQFSEKESDILKFEVSNLQEKFKNISNVSLNEWFNKEEKFKHVIKTNSDIKIEIEEWEDRDEFMGDLSFFISVNNIENKGDNTFEKWQRYYQNYVEIVDKIRNKENEVITNTYRLFLLYIGVEKIEHKPRVSWDVEGVVFSTIDRNILFNEEFKKMCFQENVDSYCRYFIKNKFNEWDLFNLNKDNFTTEKALKCWLTLKVLYANMEDVCLNYWDGSGQTGVSVYKNANDNRLIKSEPFSIYNMICGFGVKSGRYGSYISYHYEFCKKPTIIDIPFCNMNIDENERTIEELKENQKVIDEIIEYFARL